MKKIFVNVLCFFSPLKKLPDKIRDYFLNNCNQGYLLITIGEK